MLEIHTAISMLQILHVAFWYPNIKTDIDTLLYWPFSVNIFSILRKPDASSHSSNIDWN